MPLLPIDQLIKSYQAVKPDQARLRDLENQVLWQINACAVTPQTNWLEQLFTPRNRWASTTATVAFSFFSAYMALVTFGTPIQSTTPTSQVLSLNVFTSEYATPLYPILR